ncbi:HAD-IIIC family phosphatase [Ruminiclostridium cellobioparum]|uniref:FkbH-like protein n=1 Tax=Ruminiclostridium cellobioparum subsp. termitidis CT1112 TaxID=1195236 RepID=S0FVW8_RUMCE|nr:HAD-IIIC family phosphatase [Ruminiclostridium cellobioparum]EMS72713.1 FkbH-like protein [Ruminiclostridium cellobioparum subsp. termitidis CT1112]
MEKAKDERKIKCIVWDLDNTVWNGVLLEGDTLTLREGVAEVIRTLDERGILQSIASKNEYDAAMTQLKKFGIDEYFIYHEINWGPKSNSIKNIAKSINIGIDTLAFVDDQQFELEEVQYSVPEILCIHADKVREMLTMPELNPRFITSDSKLRRQMYMSDIRRNNIEQAFEGTQDEFLSTLNMNFTISKVGDDDLKRAEELTVRTHQLNATGYTYSYEELDFFRKSKDHLLLIAGLEDKYGTYGKIGLCLLECTRDSWTLKLLLMSCRVMSRGVGAVMINLIIRMAKEANVRLFAEFLPTNRNRTMYVTYKFAGFKEVGNNNGINILENGLSYIPPLPDYIKLNVEL